MNLNNLQAGAQPDDEELENILDGAQPEPTIAELDAQISAQINANLPPKTRFSDAPITEADIAAESATVTIPRSRFKRMRQQICDDRETINTLTVSEQVAKDSAKRLCTLSDRLVASASRANEDNIDLEAKLEAKTKLNDLLNVRLGEYVGTIETITSELSTERLNNRRNVRNLNREIARLRRGGPVLRQRADAILVEDSDPDEGDELDGDPTESDEESEFVPSSPMI